MFPAVPRGLVGGLTSIGTMGVIPPAAMFEGPIDPSTASFYLGGDYAHGGNGSHGGAKQATATAGLYENGKWYIQLKHGATTGFHMSSNLLKDSVVYTIKFDAALANAVATAGVTTTDMKEPVSGEDIVIETSTNGSSWSALAAFDESTLSTGAWTACSHTITAGTIGSDFRIRVYGNGAWDAGQPKSFIIRNFRVYAGNTWYGASEDTPRIAVYTNSDSDNTLTTQDLVNFYTSEGTEIGSISTNDGSTITYGAFTGVHYRLLTGQYIQNSLVKIDSVTELPQTGKEPIYNVSYTSKSQDKSILGVLQGQKHFYAEDGTTVIKTIVKIAAIGNGKILVSAEGGNINIGDYLCSTTTAGAAKKQTKTQLHNYTVAKSTESVDWSQEFVWEELMIPDDPSDPNSSSTVVKQKKLDENGDPVLATSKIISCTYHAG